MIETGGGWISAMRWQRSRGVRLMSEELTAGTVLERWPDVESFDDAPNAPTSVFDAVADALGRVPDPRSTTAIPRAVD